MMRTLLRRIDRFRRDHTTAVSKWVYRQLGRDKFLLDERIEPEHTHRILVLRNNKRIGNMYFMLPFLNALRDAYPKAAIDLMVIDAQQAAIFQHMGIDRVLVSKFSFYHLWHFAKLVFECRKTVYDLVLMPHSSASDTIIGALVHARNKVSFWGPETVGVYRHAFDIKPNRPHAAHTALTLLQALGHSSAGTASHLMSFSDEETLGAQETVRQLKGTGELCIAYFRGARGNKIISDPDWHRIRQLFDQAAAGSISWVEILSPDITTPLINGTRTFASDDLRQLAAVLAATDLFICGDTGPLHLADAAGAHCVGLFTATSTEHYGCLGQNTVNITDLSSIDPSVILNKLAPSFRPVGQHT